MTISDYIQQASLTQDQFLSVCVGQQYAVDENQMAVQNSNTAVMLGCIRDRYTANLLLYDTRNHITMRQFLETVPFDVETFRQLIIQMMESVDQFSRVKLSQTNILFSLDEVYIDVITKRLKFVYIPVRTSIAIDDAMETLSAMLRETLQIARVADGHTLMGLVLMHINSKPFQAVKFYRDILDYESVTRRRSFRAMSRVMLAYILTVLILAAAVLGVPLWGLLTKTYQLTQFIDMNTLFFEALLLLGGAIVACFAIIPLREIKKYRRKAANTIPKVKKQKKKGKKQKEALAVPEAGSVQAAEEKTEFTTPALVGRDGREHRVNSSEFTIGRDEAASALCVGEPSVSANHASILRLPDGYFLRDNGSRNGTFHNGARLNPGEPVMLNNMDKLRFADEEFTFQW